MQIENTANQMDIKAAYRQLQKKVHPDILGDEQGHDMSILLNDVCSLSRPHVGIPHLRPIELQLHIPKVGIGKPENSFH